jgi:hypothetical protein
LKDAEDGLDRTGLTITRAGAIGEDLVMVLIFLRADVKVGKLHLRWPSGEGDGDVDARGRF